MTQGVTLSETSSRRSSIEVVLLALALVTSGRAVGRDLEVGQPKSILLARRGLEV